MTELPDTRIQLIREVKVLRRRVAELEEERERRALEFNAELQRANEELDAFTYSVSHDLRAPLRAIDGFSQAVIEDYSDRLDTLGIDFLTRVRTEAQRMAQLIDDLLNLSRLSRTALRPTSVNLSQLAHGVAERLKQQEPQRNVDFRLAGGLIAEADERLISVVLEHLLQNAWKFTGTRERPRIEFNSETLQDGRTAWFVRDNGVGFDMAYSHQLFGAFQRLHSSTEFPGTGIGLATVQRVIHRHGGEVWAEAAPGSGATFFFTLRGFVSTGGAAGQISSLPEMGCKPGLPQTQSPHGREHQACQ